MAASMDAPLPRGAQCDSRVERVVVDSVTFAAARETGRQIGDEGLSLCSIILVGVDRRGRALISGARLTRLGGSDAFGLALQGRPLVGGGRAVDHEVGERELESVAGASLSPAWQAAPDA